MFSLLKCSLQNKNKNMPTDPKKFNIAENEDRMGHKPETFSSKFHVMLCKRRKPKNCIQKEWSSSVTVFNLEDVKSLSHFVFISQNVFKLLPTFPFHHAVCLNGSYNISIFITHKIVLYPLFLQLQLLGSFKELRWLL